MPKANLRSSHSELQTIQAGHRPRVNAPSASPAVARGEARRLCPNADTGNRLFSVLFQLYKIFAECRASCTATLTVSTPQPFVWCNFCRYTPPSVGCTHKLGCYDQTYVISLSNHTGSKQMLFCTYTVREPPNLKVCRANSVRRRGIQGAGPLGASLLPVSCPTRNGQ